MSTIDPVIGGTGIIATPNFGGFVPNLKHQYGETYGNATRHILRMDPTIKAGVLQGEVARRKAQAGAGAKGVGGVGGVGGVNGVNGASTVVAGGIGNAGNGCEVQPLKRATGDDRFSFPPVPGYTGYIPRAQEHFGHPYVETTQSSLKDFHSMLAAKKQLPVRIQAIVADRAAGTHRKSSNPPPTTTKHTNLATSPYAPVLASTQRGTPAPPGGFAAGNASGASDYAPVKSHGRGQKGEVDREREKERVRKVAATTAHRGPHPTFTYSADMLHANGATAGGGIVDDASPYKMPRGHPSKTFVGGYTGFVPRLQNHFGETYPDNVRKALDEFTSDASRSHPTQSSYAYGPPQHQQHYQQQQQQQQQQRQQSVQPIPANGFTGFIPGSRSQFAQTFGKTAEVAYAVFNADKNRGGGHNAAKVAMGTTDHLALVKNRPIAGYRGHIPSYIFHGDRPYAIDTGACLEDFNRVQHGGRAAMGFL